MRRLALILLLLLPGLMASAQVDSLQAQLDSTVLSSERNTSLFSAPNALETSIHTDLLRKAPSLLGSDDPIRFLHLLPGVQTNTEIDAGIHVQGMDQDHCLVSIGEVPLYGAAHLMGLFSIFIPTHYGEMSLAQTATRDNRLGAVVDLSLRDKVPDRFHGKLLTGLLSTEATFDAPLGKRSVLSLSLRKSYIGLLYGSFLRLDDNNFDYDFFDGNLTWFWQPSDRDKVWLDMYGGTDLFGYGSLENGMDIRFHWYNRMGAAHWEHQFDGASLRQSIYYSRYDTDMDLTHAFIDIQNRTFIGSLGYRGTFTLGGWNAGLDFAWHQAAPPGTAPQQALEATLSASYRWQPLPFLTLTPSLKAIWWSCGNYLKPFALPSLAVQATTPVGEFELDGGLQRQHLFRTGSSGIGFPSEFWLLSTADAPPQESAYAILSYRRNLYEGRYGLQTSVYWRGLRNQLDYDGSVLDYAHGTYRLQDHLKVGRGMNYGLTVLLHKQAGALTGWVGYTLSRSLREVDGWVFPSSHERIHELNLVASYEIKKWELNASMVLASGTPFTPAEAFYMVGGQMVSSFPQRNSSRLGTYFHLDLSATWYIRKGPKLTHGLTLSLYNATGAKNDVARRLYVEKDGSFAYKPIHFYIRFLPSISYFLQF